MMLVSSNTTTAGGFAIAAIMVLSSPSTMAAPQNQHFAQERVNIVKQSDVEQVQQ